MTKFTIPLAVLTSFIYNTFIFGQKSHIPQFLEETVYKSINKNTDSLQLYKFANGIIYEYQKPRLFEFVGSTFKNLYNLPQIAFNKHTIPTWITVCITSSISYYYDSDLITLSQRFGKWAGIPGDNARGLNVNNKRVNLLKNSPLPIYVPGDIGYAMYYIGDGFTDIGITLGFLGYGFIKKDYRALRVASELTEGLLSVGIVIQTLKRSFGRQTPFRSDEDGNNRGKWRPFSSDYNNNVPNYDAMPSGHLATSTMVLIVLADNYPEYKWIYPTGIGLMTLLGYQMMNNGVHWMSDYPLAIVVGYGIGKMIVARGRKRIKLNETTELIKNKTWNYMLTPITSKNLLGASLRVTF